MTEITYSRTLELAEIQQIELSRWRVVHNESLSDFQWEVCRDDDAGRAIMVVGCRSQQIAWNEHEEQATAAGIKAVLAACNQEQT